MNQNLITDRPTFVTHLECSLTGERYAADALHNLSRADTQHGVHAGLDEEGEMGIGTQAPISHQYIPFLQARMDRLHPGQIVGEEGRDDQLQEHTRARMEQPQ